MSADALTAATEELAPARATTNFFDPTQGQNVIARYKNARIAAEGAKAAYEGANAIGEAQSRLERSRIDRAAARRSALQFDRDEEEYAEKSDYKAQRGQFLDTVSSIDPTADDYDEQISSFLKDLPMGVRDDDALQAIITHKNRAADSVRTEKEMQLRRQEQLADQKELIRERVLSHPSMKYLTPEEIQSARDPVTGEYDQFKLGSMSYQKERADKKEDSAETAEERARIAREAKAADVKTRQPLFEAMVKNQEAFPSQVVSFQKAKMAEAEAAKKTATVDTIEEDFPAEMSAAVAYEKDKLNSEIASALAREDVEDYVNLVPNLNKTQKELRRKLWSHARELEAGATPETGEQGSGQTQNMNISDDERAELQAEIASLEKSKVDADTDIENWTRVLERETDPVKIDSLKSMIHQREVTKRKKDYWLKVAEGKLKGNAAPETGEPAAPKPLTPEAKADIMERAGGDPVKAKQIAIEEGY